ncbi:MAG: folylpolyglutamate synthase/dihydrofolate synthase family protein [Chloroflexota bacterium]
METESDYQAALEYLYSFVDFSLTRGFRFSPDQFELGRMRDFMAHLGHPDQAYPILHVAGTKGKGSVAALCASALRAAGYRVGLYTSPHLMDYAERIQLDGSAIPHQELVALVEEIRPYLDAGTRLTTFEITTALAFLYFARQGATAVVAEVGLGGRLDATNVVMPRVAVITSISYDHVNVLGHTLAEIASEKAGIIKPGVPVVVAPQKEEARLVIERAAAEQAAPLIRVGQDVLFTLVSHTLDGQMLLAWRPEEQAQVEAYLEGRGPAGWEPVSLTIPLLGHHQVENAATAYAALQTAHQQGLELGEAAIRAGFAQVSWPGRFEVLRREPPVVIDSAHNRDSALKLRLALDDYYPGRAVVLVFGASEDKDVEGMFAELMPRVQQVIATRSYHPRAMEPELLVELAQRYGKPARVVGAVEDALVEAIQQAGQEALVLATGSLFVAAGVRETWYNGCLDLEAGKTAV